MARAMRPLPSSKGWMVTNQRCATPGLEHQIGRARPGRTTPEMPPSRPANWDAAGASIMDPLVPDGTGDNLHGAALVLRHAPTVICAHAAAPGREQGGMPGEQALVGQRLGVFLGGIEHHLDDALDVPVGRRQRADIHPQPARDRGSNLILFQDLALDLTGLDDLLGQRSRTASSRKRKPSSPSGRSAAPDDGGRTPTWQKAPLDPSGIPASRSVRGYTPLFSALSAEIIGVNLRTDKSGTKARHFLSGALRVLADS